MMTLDPEVLRLEKEGIATAFAEDENKVFMAGGEVAKIIEDLTTMGELVERVMREAEEIVCSLPQKVIGG